MTIQWSIYLIEAQNGMVKIGHSISPQQRLKSIQTVSPVPTRLIAMWQGSRVDEKNIHKKFEKCRNHNEWFLLEGELLEFVNAVRGLGLSEIIPWSGVMFFRDRPHSEKTRLLRSYGVKLACDRKKAKRLGISLQELRPDLLDSGAAA